MEIDKPDATQLPLTPETANPPAKPLAPKPDRYAVPEVILPPEDKPLLSREEAREERRNDYIKNGS